MEEQSKAPVQYVLVRKDLVDASTIAVHHGHARVEAIRVAPVDKRCVVRALFVADEPELTLYADRLRAKGFHVALVLEDSGPHAGQSTALGIEPLTERISVLGRLFYHLSPMRL